MHPHIVEIGYHCRDYFVKQWDRFKDTPWGDLAHSTHLRGAGTYDAVDGERLRVTVTLATGIPEEQVRAINLDYLDPAAVDPDAWAADPDTLVVPQAGEVLYRLAENVHASPRDVHSAAASPRSMLQDMNAPFSPTRPQGPFEPVVPGESADRSRSCAIGHVHLRTADIDRIRAFYVDLMGFDVVFEALDVPGWGTTGDILFFSRRRLSPPPRLQHLEVGRRPLRSPTASPACTTWACTSRPAPGSPRP